MNTRQLQELHALRALREQRAARELAEQQQRCNTAQERRDLARQRLHEHRMALAQNAERLLGQCAAGLSVQAWCEAQEQLQAQESQRQALQAALQGEECQLSGAEQAREQWSRQRAQRQRQAQACEALLDDQQRLQRRAAELREEPEQPLAQPGGAA